MGTIYVATKDLPLALQGALASVGYGRKDIAVDAKETVNVQSFAGAGRRDFYIVVNLVTGEHKATFGSWGGPNAYCLDNRVDTDDKDHPIPVNGAIIQGTEGGGQPVYCNITVNPANLAALLPPAVEVTEDEKHILACYRSLKSGEYRRQALTKVKNYSAVVDALVSRGLLKRSSNGATQITTEGKNAIAAYRPML